MINTGSYKNRQNRQSGLDHLQIELLKKKRRDDRTNAIKLVEAENGFDRKINSLRLRIAEKESDVDNLLDDPTESTLNYVCEYLREIEKMEVDIKNLEHIKNQLFPHDKYDMSGHI